MELSESIYRTVLEAHALDLSSFILNAIVTFVEGPERTRWGSLTEFVTSPPTRTPTKVKSRWNWFGTAGTGKRRRAWWKRDPARTSDIEEESSSIDTSEIQKLSSQSSENHDPLSLMQSRIDKAPPSPRAKGRKEESVGSPVVADPLSYMQALIAKDFDIEPLNTNDFREYKPFRDPEFFPELFWSLTLTIPQHDDFVVF